MARALDGDNDAAREYLAHLREVSKNIEAWQKSRKKEEKEIAAEKRKEQEKEI